MIVKYSFLLENVLTAFLAQFLRKYQMWFRQGLSEEDCTNSGWVPLILKAVFLMFLRYEKSIENWSGPDGEKKSRNLLCSDKKSINCLVVNQNKRPSSQGTFASLRKARNTRVKKLWFGAVFPCTMFVRYFLFGTLWLNSTIRTALEIIILPFGDEEMLLLWTFQQVNDPKLTSKFLKDWFFAKKIDVLDWPSQSPDLKPIENLGDILKYQLPSRTFINKKDLWVFVQKSWYEMPTSVCQKLISSMPKRISKNIFNNGGYTGD